MNSITEELDQRKKQIDLKVNSVTDANPLVEIRAAIQRLRKENRELDIRIGMLVSVMVIISGWVKDLDSDTCVLSTQGLRIDSSKIPAEVK